MELGYWDSIAAVIPRVCPAAQEKLIIDRAFGASFSHGTTWDSFVLAVDLRKSSDLLSGCDAPSMFAEFIVDLCDKLHLAITAEYGLYDKFTGDGVLAFFPTFLTGPDAGVRVLRAARTAHEFVNETLQIHTSSFDAPPDLIGAGIGIDFGAITVLNRWGAITAVGKPVVNACYLSSNGLPNDILVTARVVQSPLMWLQSSHFAYIPKERKHRGMVQAYRFLPDNPIQSELRAPSWL